MKKEVLDQTWPEPRYHTSQVQAEGTTEGGGRERWSGEKNIINGVVARGGNMLGVITGWQNGDGVPAVSGENVHGATGKEAEKKISPPIRHPHK